MFDDEVADRSSAWNPESTKKRLQNCMEWKKSEQQDTLAELLLFFVCKSGILHTLWWKKKRSSIRQFAVQWHLKGQDTQTGSIMQFIGSISMRAHTSKNTWATALAAALRERILLTEQLAWKGRRRKNNFRDWKPTISLLESGSQRVAVSWHTGRETPQKMKYLEQQQQDFKNCCSTGMLKEQQSVVKYRQIFAAGTAAHISQSEKCCQFSKLLKNLTLTTKVLWFQLES